MVFISIATHHMHSHSIYLFFSHQTVLKNDTQSNEAKQRRNKRRNIFLFLLQLFLQSSPLKLLFTESVSILSGFPFWFSWLCKQTQVERARCRSERKKNSLSVNYVTFSFPRTLISFVFHRMDESDKIYIKFKSCKRRQCCGITIYSVICKAFVRMCVCVCGT